MPSAEHIAETQARVERNKEIEQRRRQEQAEQEKLEKMSRSEREAFFEQQRKEQERIAHEQAVAEAQKIAKETPGSQRITVRTTFTDTEARSRITGSTNLRSEKQAQSQFATSGAPVQLEGDPAAIQQVRGQALQQATRKAQERGGGTVDEAAINREIRNILGQTGGQVSVADRAAENERTRQILAAHQMQKPLQGAADYPVLVPKGRGVYEGVESSGDITSVMASNKDDSITTTEMRRQPLSTTKTIREMPKMADTMFEAKGEPLPRDFASGAAAEFRNIAGLTKYALEDLFLGRKVPRYSYDIKTGEIISKSGIPDVVKPTAETETFSAIGRGQQSLTIKGLPVGGSVLFTEQSFKNLGESFGRFAENPAYFAGTAATSVALWFGPGAAFKVGRLVTGAGKAPKFGSPGYARGQFEHLAKLDVERYDMFKRTGDVSFVYPFKKPDAFTPRTPVIYASNTFKPFTVTTLTRAPSFSTPTDKFIEKPQTPAVINAKRITTMKDIDKRLGLDVKDKGDFSEVRTRTGQVLLVKKPTQTQIQQSIAITKQETAVPQRVTARAIPRQQSRIFERFTLGLGGDSGLSRVIARRKQRQLGLSFITPQIEREAILEAQRLSLSQQSMFGQGQRFKFDSIFKQSQMTKMLQKQQTSLKFQPLTAQLQRFKFAFPRVTRTVFDIPTPPPGTPPPTITPPRRPPLEMLLGAADYPGQKKKRRGKIKASPRSAKVASPLALLGEASKLAKKFEKEFGKLY